VGFGGRVAKTSLLPPPYNGSVVLGLALTMALLHPAPAEGAALLGRPSPDWPARRWMQGGPLQLADLRGRVVLLRFFMESDCPYCRGTAPTLNALHEDLAARGLVVIGMYTPKPRPRPVAAGEVERYVADYGFRFPVAVDEDWAALRRLWLDRVPGASFTSSSLVIDRRGVVRHVHPGGIFAAGSPDTRARQDYEALRAAIDAALADPAR
jgi:peroxiredoxin